MANTKPNDPNGFCCVFFEENLDELLTYDRYRKRTLKKVANAIRKRAKELDWKLTPKHSKLLLEVHIDVTVFGHYVGVFVPYDQSLPEITWRLRSEGYEDWLWEYEPKETEDCLSDNEIYLTNCLHDELKEIDKVNRPIWTKMPLLGHLIENYFFVWYFGFEAAWFPEPYYPIWKKSFFHNTKNGILSCKQCFFFILLLRLLTLPITLTRDVVLYVLLHNNITRGRTTYFLKNIHEKHIDKISLA